MPSRSSTKRRRNTSQPAPAAQGLTRVKAVWISFLGTMTVLGGALLALDGKPSPRTDGLSLSPLAAATTIGTTRGTDPLTQTRVALDKGRWQAIVIHHSGAPKGDAAGIEAEHQSRNFKGLGHHFIIGNGSGMDDGQVHIGYRWLDQQPGAHAAGANGDWYNQHGISICLVGDGNRRGFTQAQLQQLQTLVESLRRQLNLPADRVLLHSDVAPAVSDPGKLFPPDLYGQSASRG